MNSETFLRARDNLYSRMATRLIKSLVPFLGTTPDRAAIAKVTRPIVIAARQSAQIVAYQDYLKFIDNQNPIPKMDQNRFTDELWEGSIDKAIGEAEIFGSSEAETLTLSADYWARDAEWGQRVDSAKKDSRIEKVARVDFEPPTCPFCTLLNSRGAVYLSTESAMRTLHTGDTCTCIFVRPGEKNYRGSEHTKLAKDRYDAAVRSLGTAANTTTILRALGDQDPNRPTGRVKKHVQDTVTDSVAAKVTQAKARIAALEKLNPKSDSAIKYRAEQLARNKDILRSLEG